MWSSPGTDAHAGQAGAWAPLVHIMMEEATAALAYELLASCLWSEAGQPEQAYV